MIRTKKMKNAGAETEPKLLGATILLREDDARVEEEVTTEDGMTSEDGVTKEDESVNGDKFRKALRFSPIFINKDPKYPENIPNRRQSVESAPIPTESEVGDSFA